MVFPRKKKKMLGKQEREIPVLFLGNEGIVGLQIKAERAVIFQLKGKSYSAFNVPLLQGALHATTH